MEIEVGEYVRTKRGIGKILEVKTVQPKMYGKHDLAYLIDVCPRMYISDNNFIKHDKDIKKLIEEGDYVNGYYTRKIANYNNELCVFDLNTMQWTPLTEIDVFYSIVTHEQMASIEYKVEEDKQYVKNKR